ncbi:ankyrin repeat domain-containing protein 31 isoform X4 [Paroedura picta]|uniref:ankyrin repeat domain-containing protein 31 isoform X4 n=1 Tax=Paroedura picta TaxID=143630 RepID=UPI0040578C97
MADTSDSDSDETIIEGSVAESDLDEEELHVKRLSLVAKDVVSTAHNNITTEMKVVSGEQLSPEIQLIYKNSASTDMLKHSEQIIPQYSEGEKEESQSLLQVKIAYPVISTHICQSDCPSVDVVYGGDSHFNCLDSKVTGFLEASEKVPQILTGHVSSETYLCSGIDTVEVGGDSVLRCTEISCMFQSTTTTSKEDMIGKDRSLEIIASDITKSRIITDPSEVKGVEEVLSDFDSQMLSPMVDMLEYHNDAHYMDASANEENNALPVELLTALNCMSGSLAGFSDQAVEKERVHSTRKKQIDDCMQMDINFKPKLHLEQHETTEISTITKLPCHSELDSNQHTYKLVLSDHQSIMSYGGPVVLSETSSSEQTIQETLHTLRKSTRKRRYFTHDGVYALNDHRFLEGSHQKKQSYKAQKRLPAKNSETCELKDKGDWCSQQRIASSHGSLTDMNGRVGQMRKSQRIAKKSRKQTTFKNLNDSSFNYMPLSSINRRDIFGQTLLHRAVIQDDLDRICTVINAGAIVNAKDYAGWTALHEASLAGFFEATNELLKAGADVNCKGYEQVTPLHDAVKEGHYKVAELLLWYGADPLFKHEKGKCALEEATDKQMKKLLENYIAKSARSSTSGGRELRPSQSRKTRHCYDCYGKDNLSACFSTARQESRTHESISEILQDIEEKQNKLLLFELRNQKDADLYIQDLSQMQSVLNEVLAKQKSERDDLAKKYRASVESFKQGALREQLVKLVSRQKSLLLVAQKQKELGQKIQNYKNAKKETSSSAKQIPSTSISCERNNIKDGSSDKTLQCPDVAIGRESNLVTESNFLDQEHHQHPKESLNRGNGRRVKQNVEAHNEVSKKKEHAIGKLSNFKLASAVDPTTLPSKPAISLVQTKESQLEETNCESVTPPRNTPPAAITVACALNISEATDIAFTNVSQPTTLVCVNEILQHHSNMNEANQTQTLADLESIHSSLATPQKTFPPSNRTSLTANLEFPEMVPDAPSPSTVSQDHSNCSTKQDSENQLNLKQNRRKKNQLLDLIEQGKIKPGDDVLEFRLQDSQHKASLLGNGRIKTGNNAVYQSPVQWIKALLGNDISVSWKYVWNKVTYCGTLLSKIVVEDHIPKESLQQNRPCEPSCQPTSSKQLRFLQCNEIVLIEDEELLPQHIMDQYWNLYIHCENFGF